VFKKAPQIDSTFFFQGPRMGVDNNFSIPFLKGQDFLGKVAETKRKVWVSLF